MYLCNGLMTVPAPASAPLLTHHCLTHTPPPAPLTTAPPPDNTDAARATSDAIAVSRYVFIYYFTCAPFLKTLHCNSITVFRQSSKMADILSLILDWQVHCNFEPTCLLLPTYIFPILIDEFRQTQVSRYTYLLTPQDYFEGVSISEFVNYYHHQLINISIDSWKTTKY